MLPVTAVVAQRLVPLVAVLGFPVMASDDDSLLPLAASNGTQPDPRLSQRPIMPIMEKVVSARVVLAVFIAVFLI